jgi:hypothetical protein
MLGRRKNIYENNSGNSSSDPRDGEGRLKS